MEVIEAEESIQILDQISDQVFSEYAHSQVINVSEPQHPRLYNEVN